MKISAQTLHDFLDTDIQEFEQQVQLAIASLKDTPLLDSNQPIYYPGELEAITREQR